MNNEIEKKTLQDLHKSMWKKINEDFEHIEPLFLERNAICISVSDFYAKYASLLLLSIIQNISSLHNYDIVVLTTDMSYENQVIFKTLANKKNVIIRIYNISEKVESINFYTWAHFTHETYYRLAIPELFKSFEKILYLDSDIIVNKDIYELFQFDLGDNYLGAVKDTHVMSYCNGLNLGQLDYNKNVLKLEKPTNYFQMGVSLFNIGKIRNNYRKSLLEIAGRTQYKWLDQDVLNVEFQNKIYELPLEWNVMIANKPPYCDEYYLPDEYRVKYYEARKNPCIIHYCGGVYYRFPFVPDMKRYFWKYAVVSPYFEEIITRMIILKLPQNDFQNKELEYLKQEFQKFHFPNINNHFAENEKAMRLLFVMNHKMAFRIRKLYYGIRKNIKFCDQHQKYQQKYDFIKRLLQDAMNMWTSVFRDL